VALWTATLWLDDISQETHSATGLARLIWQYRGDQPRMQAWLEAFLDQVQSVEDVAFACLTDVWPLTAEGDQLDVIGNIVVQPRGELTDDPYRLAILGRIFVNLGDGQLPQFYELLDILGLLEDARAYDFWPAAVEVSAVLVEYPDVVGDLVGDLGPGGVLLFFVHSDVADDETFQTSATLGADDIDADTGLGPRTTPSPPVPTLAAPPSCQLRSDRRTRGTIGPIDQPRRPGTLSDGGSARWPTMQRRSEQPTCERRMSQRSGLRDLSG